MYRYFYFKYRETAAASSLGMSAWAAPLAGGLRDCFKADTASLAVAAGCSAK
jgi:hypothetical protein